MAHYQPLVDAQSHIRLIDLLPLPVENTYPGVNIQLQCNLRTVDLESSPKYVALSYVWGDMGDTRPLLLDGTIVNISKNLVKALECLFIYRSTKPSNRKSSMLDLPIWADALCINQVDTKERNQQVSIMGRIYREAEHVIGWIGDPFNGVEESINLPHHLRSWANSSAVPQAVLSDVTGALSVYRPDIKDSWKAIQHFVTMSFWSRRWILQELVLAKYPVLFFGDLWYESMLEFETLETAIAKVEQAKREFRGSHDFELEGIVSGSTIENIQLFLRLRRGRQSQQLQPDMLDLLQSTEFLNCKEPNDRFFAMMNLSDIKSFITVEYGASSRELFTEFARSCITTRRNLDILAYAGVLDLENSERYGIPSWVPDWTLRTGKPCFLQNIYHANGNLKWHSTLSEISHPEYYTLRAEGIMFAEIETVTNSEKSHLSLKFTSDAELDMMFHFCYPTGVPFLMSLFRTLLFDYDPISKERLSTKNKSFFDLAAGFLVSLSLDQPNKRRPEFQLGTNKTARYSNYRIYPDYYQIFEWKQPNRRMDKMQIEDALAPFIGGVEPFQGPSIQWPEEIEFNRGWEYQGVFKREVESRTKDLKFFMTANQYWGFGPRGIAEGDKICVLDGCSVPLVLRQKQDNHIVIGPCFVYGLMDGEAVEFVRRGEKQMQEIRLF